MLCILFESRWILIFQRQTYCYVTTTFIATWKGYFYELRPDPQCFEPEKLFNPFRPDIAQLQQFSVGGYGFFRRASWKGLNCLPPPPPPLHLTRWSPKPHVDLLQGLRKCHGKFSDASNYRDQMHKEPPPPRFPTPLWSRKSHVDLPLDLGKVHGKFGDASYYRDWMHKEQTNKQTNKHSSLYI